MKSLDKRIINHITESLETFQIIHGQIKTSEDYINFCTYLINIVKVTDEYLNKIKT